jgi:hypothetical protein
MGDDRGQVRAFRARPLPTVRELLRVSQEITEREKRRPGYRWVAYHLPVLFDALSAPETEGEKREWARNQLELFAMVEAEAFWKAKTRNQRFARPEAMFNDWGRYLVVVAGMAASMTAARYVRKETLPLNAAADIMDAIQHDLGLFWREGLGLRIVQAQVRRDERSTLDEAALIWVLKQSWAWGAETQDDRTLVAVIGALYPEALVKYRLSPPQAEDVCQILRERHRIDLKSPENCRKRFSRLCERVKREAPRITQIAEAIRTIPTE